MPYDPRMMQQIGQMGVGMMGPQQGNPFAPGAAQPKQWWDQPMPSGRLGGAQSPQDDPSKPDDPNAPKRPPSLYEMMMNLGRMTRPQYDKAIQGPGAYGISPQTAAYAGPWALLGSMGLPGGQGRGGNRTPGY